MNSDDPARPGPSPGGAPPAGGGLAAGQLVGGGRYLLTQLLGQGGMGVVWLAKDQRLGEWLALKFLPPEVRHDAVALDDMRRETLKSRRLTHPNIVRIHDFHEAPGEAPFISMEYVDGDNLSNLRLAQPARVFTWEYLAPLVRQLCQALHYAHEEKIIHRDLKPSNLMLDGRGRLKLADFGIAATVSDSMSRVSVAKASGTVTYMSPQQLDGRTPKVTDDIYALGATLYEFLTSKPPFYTGDIPHQVRTYAPDAMAQRLSDFSLANDIPPAAAAMVMACLSKDPEQRPPSARAVAEWIGLTLATPGPAPSHEAAAPAPPVQAGDSAPAAAAEWSEATDEAATGPVRPTWRPLALTLALLGVAAVGSIVFWKWPRPKTVETTAMTVSLPAEQPPPVNSVVAAPLSAAALDANFTAMFNGRDLTGWKGDPRYWSVQDGILVGQLPQGRQKQIELLFWAGGVVEDFELRFKYRFTSGNSGVYYRAKELAGRDVGGYQFEIWSDKVGNLIETGNDRPRRDLSRRGQRTIAQMLDGKTRLSVSGSAEASPSDVEAALRQGGWMNVILTAQGNRLIHKVNGRTIADVTDEYSGRPRTGVIALELHETTHMEFRDLEIKRPAPVTGNGSGAGAPVATSTSHLGPLFDGKTLSGWTTTDPERWRVEPDGTITCEGPASSLLSTKLHANMELSLEVKFSRGGVGGVIARAQPDGSGGYVAQARGEQLGVLGQGGALRDVHVTHTGILPEDTWCTQRLYVVGNQFVVYFNDRLVVNFRPSGTPPVAGPLVLQQWLANGKVSYRNVRARALPSDPSAAWQEAARFRADLPRIR